MHLNSVTKKREKGKKRRIRIRTVTGREIRKGKRKEKQSNKSGVKGK